MGTALGAAPRPGADDVAALLDGHEGRVYNFCHRVLASPDAAAEATRAAFARVLHGPGRPAARGRDLAVELLAAGREAGHDQGGARGRDQPGGANASYDLAYADPDRAAMLAALGDDVRAASTWLTEDERGILALRDLEQRPYEDVAEVMGVPRDAVARLVSHARLRLRDELRGSALAASAGPSGDCERALPLISARQDGELPDASERGWLGAHLEACDACRARRAAIQEAGISYRAWLPVLPPEGLREAILAAAPAEPAPDGPVDVAAANGALAVTATLPGAATTAVHQPVLAPTVEPGLAPAARQRRLLGGGLAGLALLLGFSTAVAIATDGTPRRVFRAHGRPSAALAPRPAAAHPTVRKKRARPARPRLRFAVPPPRATPTATTPAPAPHPPKPRRRTTTVPSSEEKPGPPARTAPAPAPPTTSAPTTTAPSGGTSPTTTGPPPPPTTSNPQG